MDRDELVLEREELLSAAAAAADPEESGPMYARLFEVEQQLKELDAEPSES